MPRRKLDPNRLRSDYYENRKEVDPFPDSDAVDMQSNDEREKNDAAQIDAMIQRAKHNVRKTAGCHKSTGSDSRT